MTLDVHNEQTYKANSVRRISPPRLIVILARLHYILVLPPVVFANHLLVTVINKSAKIYPRLFRLKVPFSILVGAV